MTPDDFPIVMDRELRELWREHRNIDVRRLILEVHRAREVHRICHAAAHSAHYALGEKQHDQARVFVQKVLDCIGNEKVRLGAMGGIPVQRPIKR
ncbi:hypothetical protein QYH69_32285 [Paraburkholderia sp. SARCC-3016]|uniref:hypothetical protein n=1 Tax=Paraburkholderia sp. SARCC-3016 TaxID=3058611 RepID=UPI002809F881|nr:hypothetical protein [Paraburkholderia sp. SARCC-3016]MDQ7981903.1 hypothetical protein [Paraburkholderia sp. SARCC-3016]